MKLTNKTKVNVRFNTVPIKFYNSLKVWHSFLVSEVMVQIAIPLIFHWSDHNSSNFSLIRSQIDLYFIDQITIPSIFHWSDHRWFHEVCQSTWQTTFYFVNKNHFKSLKFSSLSYLWRSAYNIPRCKNALLFSTVEFRRMDTEKSCKNLLKVPAF